jgi:hypothetical protein
MTDAGEIIKSGAGEKIADLLHRLAGPMFDEFGAILADKVRVYRAKNLVATMQKTERILREAGLPVNTVPTRLLLPIMEASSIEDNETLQDMWAGLLATASQETDAVSPSFVETLKQLTPDEARFLEELYADTMTYAFRGLATEHLVSPYAFSKRLNPLGISRDTFERLGLIRREYGLTKESDGQDIGIAFRFTEYALKFMQACQGPSAASSESDATTPQPDQ